LRCFRPQKKNNATTYNSSQISILRRELNIPFER
jgi:hypothetical protein